MAVEVAQVVDVNLVAVLVAAVAAWVLGAVWYSPVLFAKPWLKMVTARGAKEKDLKDNAAVAMVGSGLVFLVMSYVLAYLVGLVGADSFVEGVTVGAWIGLGFVATWAIVNALYDGTRKKMWAINTGYSVLALMLMGAILGVWR